MNPLSVPHVVITVKQWCFSRYYYYDWQWTNRSTRILKLSYFWTSNYILTGGNVEICYHNVVCMFSSPAIIFYFPSCYLVLFMFLFSFHEQVVEFVRRHKRALPDKQGLSSRFKKINSLPKKMDATSFLSLFVFFCSVFVSPFLLLFVVRVHLHLS